MHNSFLYKMVCYGDSGTDLKSQFLRNILFVCFFFVSGKEAKRMNGSLVGIEQSVPTLHPPLSKSYSFDEVKVKNAGIYRTFDKQDLETQMPKSTKNSSILSLASSKFTINYLGSLWQNRKQEKMPKFERERRQIVPLPKTTPKPFTVTWKSLSREVKHMIKLYKYFLADYAFIKKWDTANFVIPNNQVGFMACMDFSNEVLLSKASFHLDCFNESMYSRIKSDSPEDGNSKPFIIADFINNQRDLNTTQLINPHLLLNYSPKQPILLLAGNETVAEILERSQPEFLKNYKWTLVKAVITNNSTVNGNPVEGRLEIYDVVGFASSSSNLCQQIGRWNENRGLIIDEAKIHGVYSFEGKKLRVATVSGPPVVNLHRTNEVSGNKRLLVATGYLPDILELTAFVLNFTYTIGTPADGKFGEIDENGNWSGMVGMLQRNEADIALMSFSYTKSRKSIMDFSPPVEYSSTRFLIRKDWQPAEFKWDAFIRPFEWKVWLTILGLIGLGTFTLAVLVKFKLYKSTPCESAWLLTTCFLLQGQSEHATIRVTPYRIAVGSFWILAVFIFACYTARLTSFLAADTDVTPVKDFSEALRTVTWKIGLVKGSSFLEKVKDSKDHEMALLWKQLQKDSSVLVDGISNGVTKVYKERFIFFTSELIPQFLVRGNCSYAWLPGKYFPGFGSIGYQKNLPYASGITHVIAKIRETGLMRRTFKKWWGLSSTCNGKGADAFLAISLLEAGSAFFVLSVGASLAVLFAIIEYVAMIRSREHQRQIDLLQLSTNEFGAPILHGTMSNTLPSMLEEDKSFVWNIKERMEVSNEAFDLKLQRKH